MIACVCGYRGAGISDGTSLVCPICRTPVAPAAPAPVAAAPSPAVAPPPPPAPPGGL